MNSTVEHLLSEIAKPPSQFNKSNILKTLSSIDASNTQDAAIIYFIVDSLFDFVGKEGCPISMNELVSTLLKNVTLLPTLYQNNIKSDGKDPELDQMIAFINSFKQ